MGGVEGKQGMLLRQRTTLLDGFLLKVVFPNSYQSRRYRWVLRLARMWSLPAAPREEGSQPSQRWIAWLHSTTRELVRLLSFPVRAHGHP